MSDAPKTLGECSIKDLLSLQVQLLMDIRDALVVEAAESNECQHPENRRVSLSTANDPDHWVCLDCKLDNKADAVMN